VDPANNEFDVRCLDCRPYSHRMISFVQEKAQLDQFVVGRATLGTEHRGREPQNLRRNECALFYPFNEGQRYGPLLRSEMLEDKWDLFLWDDSLYFVRSWTGSLWHRATVEFGADHVTVREISSNTATDLGDETLPLREVDFLIRTLLCREQLPHPVPKVMPEVPKLIAQHSFSRYGRYAYFATYEDMRGLRGTKVQSEVPAAQR
jgi:hypothetical protein